MRTLVSWVATRNDFFVRDEHHRETRAQEKVNPEGPHLNLYKNFDFFDRHILLSQFHQSSTDSRRLQSEYLANYLSSRFERNVELVYMDLSDINDVAEIKAKCDELVSLEKGRNSKVEIFISPGTPSMQIAWYLQGSEYNEDIKLSYFRIREAKYSTTKMPIKEPLSFIHSRYAKGTNLIFRREKDRAFRTKSQELAYHRARLVASNYSTTVLLRGDSGTGKEYLANYIHVNSSRKEKPFIAINCASFRGEILESRLFGYEQGAFTDAKKSTKGIFEDAQGGTLFLDEIGEVSPQMQASLLRVLEERKVTRVGSTKEQKIDVRIIAGSNKDLWRMCNEGSFRIDLFYRLAVAEIALPSLMTFPKKEIHQWANHLIKIRSKEWGKKIMISEKVWNFLEGHVFLGNIRELRNIIDNFFLFAEDGIAKLEHVPRRADLNVKDRKVLTMREAQREHARLVLEDSNGNLSVTAKRLDITRVTLNKYLK